MDRSVPPNTFNMNEIKIALINANGMRVANKRRSIFDRLKKGDYDICLVQESHCTQQEDNIWHSECGGPHTSAMAARAHGG